MSTLYGAACRRLPESALVAFIVLLAGCVQAPDPPASGVVQDEDLAGPTGEPVASSYRFPGEDQATELTAELVEGVVLIEGDIALGRYDELIAAGELTPHSHGIATSYWPASTATPPYVYEIPYVVSDDFSQSYVDDVIEPAIEHWNESTASEFVPRNGEADYVEFVTVNNRCWSAVGRQVGRQEIRLDENACTRIATVVHELGHTVGLKHEQQRTDRDDFVEIVWDNIQTNPDRSGNFRLFGPGLPLGEYGYTSIMHDRRTAFAADAVIDPALDDRDLLLTWRYDRDGVPFTFASNALGESSTHRFCDGVHDVIVPAILPSQGELATDTVRVIVGDLGMTNPPDLCAISVSIDEPLAGAVFAEGATVPLSAVIDDDHPETDVPLYPVIWRLCVPDGTLGGGDLTWSWRRSGSATSNSAGTTGTSTTVGLPITNGIVDFDIRLVVTYGDDFAGVDVVTVTLYGPPS